MEAMSWLALMAYVPLEIILLFIPGLAVNVLARLKWHISLVCAPAVTVTIYTVTAIIAGALGVSWNIGWVCGATVIVAGVIAFLRRKQPYIPSDWRSELGIIGQYLLGIVFAGALLLPRFLAACGSTKNFAQMADNALHMAAINMVGNHGGGSPFHYEQLGMDIFYPSGFYDVVGLLVQVTHLGIPEAIHVCTVIICFLVWPLGVSLLVENVVKPGVFTRIATASISLAGVWFPFLLVSWGIVYPTFLAIALASSLLAMGWVILDPQAPSRDIGWLLAIFLLMVPGVAIAQPVGVLAAGMALLAPAFLLIYQIMKLRRTTNGGFPSRGLSSGSAENPQATTSDSTEIAALVDAKTTPSVISTKPRLMLGIGVLGIVGFAFAWLVSLREMGWSASWGAFQPLTMSIGQAVIGTASGALTYEPLRASYMASLSLVGVPVGIFALILKRGRHLALVFSYIVMALMYAVGCSVRNHLLRGLVTAPYYGDTPRLAAAMALVGVPVAIAGWQALYILIFKFAQQKPVLKWITSLFCGVLVAVACAFAPIKTAELKRVEDTFSTEPLYGHFLTQDEMDLIYRVPEHVGPDDLVAVNVWAGGGFIYALVDRKPTQVYGTSSSSPVDRAVQDKISYVHRNLSKASRDPKVCQDVNDLGITYALQLEPEPYHQAGEGYGKGLESLDSVPGFELVDSQGESGLYRITGCG